MLREGKIYSTKNFTKILHIHNTFFILPGYTYYRRKKGRKGGRPHYKMMKRIGVLLFLIVSVLVSGYAYLEAFNAYYENQVYIDNENLTFPVQLHPRRLSTEIDSKINIISGTAWGVNYEEVKNGEIDVNIIAGTSTGIESVEYLRNPNKLFECEIKFWSFTDSPYRTIQIDYINGSAIVGSVLKRVFFAPKPEIRVLGAAGYGGAEATSYNNVVEWKYNGPLDYYNYQLHVDADTIYGSIYVSDIDGTATFISGDDPVTLERGVEHNLSISTDIDGFMVVDSDLIICTVLEAEANLPYLQSYQMKNREIYLKPGLGIEHLDRIIITVENETTYQINKDEISSDILDQNPYYIDLIDVDGDDHCSVYTVFVDTSGYSSNEIYETINIHQGDITDYLGGGILSYNKRSVTLQTGLPDTLVSRATITGEVKDGSIEITENISGQHTIDLVDENSDGFYDIQVVYSGTDGYDSNAATLSIAVPQGAATLTSLTESYNRGTIVFQPGISYVQISTATITGEVKDGRIEITDNISSQHTIDFVDNNGDGYYDIHVVYTDIYAYESNVITRRVEVPQGTINLNPLTRSYNRGVISFQPGIDPSYINAATITGEVHNGRIDIIGEISGEHMIDFVDSNSDGFYDFQVVYIDTYEYESNVIAHRVNVPQGEARLTPLTESYNRSNIFFTSGIESSSIAKAIITGDVEEGRIEITSISGSHSIDLKNNDEDNEYIISVVYEDKNGFQSNTITCSVAVPPADFDFDADHYNGNDGLPYSYGLIGKIWLNDPGIERESISGVYVSGDIESTGGSEAFYIKSRIVNDRISVRLKPDAHGSCVITVQYADKFYDRSNIIQHTIEVRSAPASISPRTTDYFTKLELLFTADNQPLKMKLSGDITDSFKDEYIEFSNKIIVNLTSFAGEKEITVDFWNDEDDSHSTASITYILDTKGIVELFVENTMVEVQNITLFLRTNIEMVEMEIDGDIVNFFKGQWIDFVSETNLTLTPDNGEKEIRIKFKDPTGFITDEEVIALTLNVRASRIVYQSNEVNFTKGIQASLSLYIQDYQDVDVKVYEITGELVKDIWEGSHQGGILSITWDGTNDYGRKVAQGVYLLLVKVGSQKDIKEVIVIR